MAKAGRIHTRDKERSRTSRTWFDKMTRSPFFAYRWEKNREVRKEIAYFTLGYYRRYRSRWQADTRRIATTCTDASWKRSFDVFSLLFVRPVAHLEQHITRRARTHISYRVLRKMIKDVCQDTMRPHITTQRLVCELHKKRRKKKSILLLARVTWTPACNYRSTGRRNRNWTIVVGGCVEQLTLLRCWMKRFME